MNNYILHLETATKVCSVALSNNGSVISIKETVSDGYIHSESLTLFIQDVLQDAQIELSQLSAVSVSAGPGSYTGLRIGLSTAKGLCFALNIPFIAVDTLIALKNVIPTSGIPIIPMLDARRMEVYAQVFDADGKTLQELDAIVLSEDSFSDFEPFVVLGDGAAKCKEMWGHRNITWHENVLCSAKGQASIAYEKFQKKEFENLAYFSPIYLKDANGVRR
ncbi:MAG: tRNA (adenosine(37)-N6)-threonylcarbamoyltransferase complex dimerization subunit type 1 TsaB [Crocinitomicaceae bacterium]|nr:tRNA (adenosine(37)-N6)-threonylcarbamoyltransferase complex dimerization subunit type 1 TsaB [Crocinitomicaceae bacterium]MBP6032208.1 tRNA (adenosine(37)-N6)-threonylcarbamoyltransferase complex dimerization subunit type 1 TsaB [Crocinitomicaceae bacterium]